MKVFRNNNNWLNYRVASELKASHEILYIFSWRKWWLRKFCDRGGILRVILLSLCMIAMLMLCKLNFMKISAADIPAMLDQRIANIATIISLSFVVFTLMINNIAIKETFAYRILFKHSYLYLTLYVALTFLAFLLLTTNFRAYTTNTFVLKVAVIGSVLAVIIVILIGILFYRLIYFLDTVRIHEIYREELLDEAMNVIKLQLEQLSSVTVYHNMCTHYGMTETTPYGIESALRYRDPTNQNNNFKIVKDIKIGKIEGCINTLVQDDRPVIFNPIYIGCSFRADESLLWHPTNYRSNQRFIPVTQYLHLTTEPEIELNVQFFIHEKFDRCIKDSKVIEAQFILDCYFDILQLQMQYL